MAMEAQLATRLARFGVSGPGRDWLIKALHPPSATLSPGLPDESASCVLRPEYRVQAVIAPPVSALNGWDCIFLTVPGDVGAVYWAAGPTPCDFTAVAAPPGSATGVITLQPFGDNPGSVQPVPLVGPFGRVSTSTSRANALAFRHQYKSVTFSLVAAAVSDQGEVYSAQFAPTNANGPPSALYAGVDNTNATTGLPNIFCPVFYSVPLSESVMTVMAPEYYQGLARDGVYLPVRMTGPTQPFVDFPTPTLVAAGTSVGALIMGSFLNVPVKPQFWTTTGSVLGAATFTSWVVTGGALTAVNDTNNDNMNIGVTIFRGLASSGGFSSSIMVKVIAGLEFVPGPATPDRVFATPAAPYDPRALQAYYALSLELKDSYPASYNFFGSILSAVSGIASRIWPVVKGIVGGVSSQIDQPSMQVVVPRRAPPPLVEYRRPESAAVQTQAAPRARSRSVSMVPSRRAIGKRGNASDRKSVRFTRTSGRK